MVDEPDEKARGDGSYLLRAVPHSRPNYAKAYLPAVLRSRVDEVKEILSF